MPYTLTFSRTIPKGEGKFGSFEKLEITRQFEDSIPTAAAAAMCKCFVLGQLGLFSEAEAQLEQVFVAIRNRNEDLDNELRGMEIRGAVTGQGVVATADARMSQVRAYLIDLGCDIDEIRSAEHKAQKG